MVLRSSVRNRTKNQILFGVKGDSLESSKEQLQELEDALMKKFK